MNISIGTPPSGNFDLPAIRALTGPATGVAVPSRDEGARRDQHGFRGLERVRAACRAGSGVARTSRCTAMEAPVRIPVFDNQIEPALKSLKREMLKDGRFKEMKLRAFYEKPSVKRKRKQAEARKKRRKALARRARGTDD